VLALSGLTKKSVYADKVLAALLGVTEGDHVSYAQLSKGLHQYIKENNLKNPLPVNLNAMPLTVAPHPEATNTAAITVTMKRCRDCRAEILAGAVFCDLCGIQQ
jgi:predicted dienelactone hydrolase